MIRYDLIEEPDLPEQGQASLRQLLAVSFPGYPDRTYFKQIPHQRVLAWDGAEIVGHLAIDKRAMALAGAAIRTLGLVDVCVAPGWRSQGIGSALLAEAEKLGRRGQFQFAILFGDDPRLYEANGYRYQQNPCVWLKIHEHKTLGIANEALPTALMVKPLGSEPWRPGVLDLLGYLF